MGGPYREAPRTGFEPVTHRLTAGCSTVELSRKIPLPLRTMAVYIRLAISSIGFCPKNLCLHKTVVYGIPNRGTTIVHTNFLEDMFHVFTNGTFTDNEML